MKKIVFILFMMLSILSCKEQMEPMNSPQVGADGKVEVEVTVKVPDVQLPSRSLTEKPYIFHLYLAVFDEAGYLLEYVKANAAPAQDNETTYTYSVKLTPTSYPTTIHFVANASTSVSFGTETEVIGNMSTLGETDAYWQKVYLEKGIEVNEGVLDAEVSGKLTGIRLIRNFSWIKLEENLSNFELESYYVVNTRNRGSVAPYNASKQEFVDFTGTVTHAGLVADGYEAYIPANAELDKGSLIEVENYWGSEGYFIYEREMPKTDPLYILMKGTYAPGTVDEQKNRYYKVDLRDDTGNYFPVLRNFKYTVTLKSVAHAGHANAKAAAQGAGSGDVSTSIDTESFNNISNGLLRLSVSYTDTTLVSTNAVTLNYKFESLDNSIQVSNKDVEIKLEKNEVITAVNSGSADTDGWQTITINPVANTLSDQPNTETMILVGTVTKDDQTYTLQRKVRFTLRKPMTFDLVCDPDAIPKALGSPFDLLIKVPGGLGSSLFPLDFEIEAEQLSITPDLGDDLPVVTGQSIVPEKNKTTIGFIKSISWNEYENAVNESGYKAIRCHFKSNKAESATNIYAQNKYFNPGNTYLGNYIPGTFSDLKFEPGSIETVGSEVTFSFAMSSVPAQDRYVTVTLDGFEPDENEEDLIYLGIKDGKAQYKFYPTSTTNNSFDLVSTAESGSMNVKLEAYQFISAVQSIAYGYVIPAGNIKVGNNSNIVNSSIFELYTSDPGKSTNVNSFARFTASKNGSNTEDIVISNEVYEQIKDDGNVYVRFSKTEKIMNWWTTTTYYVATVSLEDLLKEGGTTLIFEQQY